MDALELLKKDHQKVKELFEKAEEAEAKQQEKIFEQIKTELETHARIEETVFYPAVQEHEELKDMVLESLEEHKQIKTLLRPKKKKKGKCFQNFDKLWASRNSNNSAQISKQQKDSGNAKPANDSTKTPRHREGFFNKSLPARLYDLLAAHWFSRLSNGAAEANARVWRTSETD